MQTYLHEGKPLTLSFFKLQMISVRALIDNPSRFKGETSLKLSNTRDAHTSRYRVSVMLCFQISSKSCLGTSAKD